MATKLNNAPRCPVVIICEPSRVGPSSEIDKLIFTKPDKHFVGGFDDKRGAKFPGQRDISCGRRKVRGLQSSFDNNRVVLPGKNELKSIWK